MALVHGGAPRLLSLPEPVLESIAQLLPQADRLNLAAACKAFHSCCPRWFPEVTLQLPIDARTKVAHLAAWLCRNPVPVHVEFDGHDALAANDFHLTALSTARLTQLAEAAAVAPRVVTLRSAPLDQLPALSDPLPAFTALESLHFQLGKLLGSVEDVWGLTRLTGLAFDGQLASGSWSGLSRLTRLRSISLLVNSDHAAVAAALTSLPHLTQLEVAHGLPGTVGIWSGVSTLSALDTLSLNCDNGAHVLHYLPAASLRRLALYTGDLGVLPARLSQCTALEAIEFGHNRSDPDGMPFALLPSSTFSQLVPLARLRQLHLISLFMIPEEVPPTLAALESLTYLRLEHTNTHRGWHVLEDAPLQFLCIVQSPLPRLPALPSLTKLVMSDMLPASEPRWSDALARQPQLESLLLRRCSLSAVPAVLSLLTRLTTLDLSGNQITAGFEHLAPLSALKELKGVPHP